MQNVLAIIDLFGGLDKLPDHPIQLKVDGYMPLSIEWVGSGPRGGVLVSVMHTFVQNGDLMRDPEVVGEIVGPERSWLPISYRHDGLGVFEEVIDYIAGQLVVNQRRSHSLAGFKALFDRNIGDQGFVTAAKELSATFTPQ